MSSEEDRDNIIGSVSSAMVHRVMVCTLDSDQGGISH